MKFWRIGLHGFMLTIINFGSLVAGIYAYTFLFRHHHPFHVQVPVGLLCTSVGFLVWEMAARMSGRISLMLHGIREHTAVYCMALLWTPILFVPLHRIVTGYFTAPGNILGVWVFQLWANVIAIGVVGWLARWGKYAVEIAS